MVNDELRDAITANANLSTIRDIATRNGLASVSDDGFRKVREGITTVSEIIRASGDLQIAPTNTEA